MEDRQHDAVARGFNILGNIPVMSLPSGFANTGVPTGIQIVGRTFDDLSVHRAAIAYERTRGGWYRSAASRPKVERHAT
jgi:amidase